MTDIKPKIEKSVLDEKTYNEIKESKKVMMESLGLKMNEDEFERLKPSKYEFIKDKLNRVKVRLYVYKGISLAEYELYSANKLKMVRLYVNYDDSSLLNLPDVYIKSEVENVDIDLSIVLAFLKYIFGDTHSVNKALGEMLDKYETVQEGYPIGVIEMGYDDFVKFVNLLTELLREGHERP